MRKGRRKHSTAPKAKVGLEAVRRWESVAQLAARYEVNTRQIPAWKHPLRRTWLADSATIEIGEAKGNGALVADCIER